MTFKPCVVLALLLFLPPLALAEPVPSLGEIGGDALPGAPELAARGSYKVGVRKLEFTNPGQLDVARGAPNGVKSVYDRKLAVELWYPARLESGEAELVAYQDYLGRRDQPGSLAPFTFKGRAARDASFDPAGGPYPLVIVSHGYPGSRFLMSYLCEHMASRGYLVASVDHTDSLYADVGAFASTLVNRPKDQRFVLDSLLKLAANTEWKGMCDPGRIGLVGYSMGGYGALRSLGAGCTEAGSRYAGDFASEILAKPEDRQDPRVDAAVLFAPWGGAAGGGATGIFDQASLKKIGVPTLWVAGSKDDVAGYSGIVKLFESATASERYLLTYQNALHNVAPNPPPPEATSFGAWMRWGEPAWDARRINNVNQHFVAAFLDRYVKGDASAAAFIDVAVEDSASGNYARNKDGSKAAGDTYWPGFPQRSAIGLSLRKLGATR